MGAGHALTERRTERMSEAQAFRRLLSHLWDCDLILGKRSAPQCPWCFFSQQVQCKGLDGGLVMIQGHDETCICYEPPK